MPKNKGKGGKTRKRGKNESDDVSSRELVFKEDGQEYGKIIKVLGGCQLEVSCYDGTIRKCHIRGKMVKKVWLTSGDIILVSVREYEKSVGDVAHKYNPDEIKRLEFLNEIPTEFHNKNNEEDDGVTFDFEENLEFSES